MISNIKLFSCLLNFSMGSVASGWSYLGSVACKKNKKNKRKIHMATRGIFLTLSHWEKINQIKRNKYKSNIKCCFLWQVKYFWENVVCLAWQRTAFTFLMILKTLPSKHICMKLVLQTTYEFCYLWDLEKAWLHWRNSNSFDLRNIFGQYIFTTDDYNVVNRNNK